MITTSFDASNVVKATPMTCATLSCHAGDRHQGVMVKTPG